MNFKTLGDFADYVQICSTETLLTLIKDCYYAHTNKHFKIGSICDGIYNNLCSNMEVVKAFKIIACPVLLHDMCNIVADEILHRVANDSLKVSD